MKRSLGLLKPDCLKRGLQKEVLALVESFGLKIAATKRVRLTRKDVDTIWSSCREMEFYEDMVDFSISGDCVVFIVEGEDAINRLSRLVGHYDPAKAEKETIRRLFGTSPMENIIHSASDRAAYKKEKSLFFQEEG